jgi:hypothetical protein
LNEDVFVFRAVGELQKNSLSWVKLVQEWEVDQVDFLHLWLKKQYLN